MSALSLTGRVAVVTGAGGGLGRAYALDLARRGASVLVNDPGTELDGSGGISSSAETVAAEIADLGGRAAASTESVATPEGGRAIVAEAVEAFGRIDIVVNNAGILRDKTFARLDWEDFDAVHAVHLRGSAHVSQAAFTRMKEQRFGRLIFISSNAGTFGNFGQSAYGSAKAGVIGLSNVLAIEGAASGILSNVVCPMARTRMTEGVLDETADVAPEAVAPLVSYLASDACRLSHMVFTAGGGHFARVFTGLTSGWTAESPVGITPEHLADHLEEILATDGFWVPMSAAEEVEGLAGILAARTGDGVDQPTSQPLTSRATP